MSSSNEQTPPTRQHPPQPLTMSSSAPVEDIPNTFLTMVEMLSPSIRSILEPVSRLLGYPSYDSFMGWLISIGVAPFWTEFERDCPQSLLALKASEPKSFPVQDVPDSALLKPTSASSAEYLAANGKVPIPAHYLTWHFNRYFSKKRVQQTKPRAHTHSIPLTVLKEWYKPRWKPYQHMLLFFGQVWIRGHAMDLDPTLWAMQLCYLLDGMTRAKYGRQLGVLVKEFAGEKRDEGCIISFKQWPDGVTDK